MPMSPGQEKSHTESHAWRSFDLSFAYDLNYASMTFGAPLMSSQRNHTGTGVDRSDLTHTIAGGVIKAF